MSKFQPEEYEIAQKNYYYHKNKTLKLLLLKFCDIWIKIRSDINLYFWAKKTK